MKLAILALVALAGPAWAQDCAPTVRMSYEASHAIKLSMVPPGHSPAEYELDHIVPLCMGGSNDRSNLQLQLWPDANRKDEDEIVLCDMVREHVLTCAEAQETMREWK
jgi:hypothetical protein